MKAWSDFLTPRVRLYRRDGNPLRRRSDRLESAVVLLSVLVVLLSVWPAVVAGRWAYDNALRDESTGSGARRQVMATLLEDAPVARVSFTEVPTGRQEAVARWATPSGEVRTGTVPVRALAKAGSAVSVWIDATGKAVAPPVDRSVLHLRGVAVGMLIVLVTALLVLCAFAGFRWWVDQARYREWDAEWARASDTWRRPRHH
ncbi:hypothetical protein GCM10009733_107940 [Nonomuraea maheshkhaliensis]|uniref:DUF3592 domain-containing protein n=1 Tax=Nonomuraea maheshkhaliensis TaxID=419590 RepID=A0ABN2HW80_9ACTN